MSSKTETLQSAGTTVDVLKALGQLVMPSPLTRVAQASGLPPAKAHRYLQALIAAGFAIQEEGTGYYGPGPELIAIGLAALGRMDVVACAAPIMTELSDGLGQSCILSVWGNAGPTVVRVVEARSAITTVTRLGSILPMRSATGLVFAALLDPKRVTVSVLEPRAARNNLSGLDGMIDAVRASGVSAIDGLLLPGIAAVAAPVHDAFGTCVAVLCCLGPSGALDFSANGEGAQRVREAASAISYGLGRATEIKHG